MLMGRSRWLGSFSDVHLLGISSLYRENMLPINPATQWRTSVSLYLKHVIVVSECI